jgi:alkylation response protein AidB-like acyl-CoA dehydrogenase
MDFTRSEAEIEVSRLAAQVLFARGPAAAAAADFGTDFDAGLWTDLARAGLLSLALPAELGGDELGVQATAAVLTEVGRRAARVPALATLALGVLPVMRSADPAVKRRLLAGVATGDTVLTAAIREPSDPAPAAPRTVATLAASGRPGTLTGLKTGVLYAAAANWILVPASTTGGDAVVAVIEPDADGLSCQRTRSSSGLPEYTLRLQETPVACLHGRQSLSARGGGCVRCG